MEKSIQVDLTKMPTEQCECGHFLYLKKTIIKRIPGLMAGATKDIYRGIDVLVCEKCGKGHKGNLIPIPAPAPSEESA